VEGSGEHSNEPSGSLKCLAERLVASQEGFSSMELVSYGRAIHVRNKSGTMLTACQVLVARQLWHLESCRNSRPGSRHDRLTHKVVSSKTIISQAGLVLVVVFFSVFPMTCLIFHFIKIRFMIPFLNNGLNHTPM
jgi:hypothetical protein